VYNRHSITLQQRYSTWARYFCFLPFHANA
jgi:hypothetical protein